VADKGCAVNLLKSQLIYLFALPFLLGIVSGFQGVWERFKYDSFRALQTLPGTVYLLSRGAIPVGVFSILYLNNLAGSWPWVSAASCGIGSETLLRTKLFIKADKQGSDVYSGLFDAVKWYQDRCLEASARTLAHRRKLFVETSMKAQSFSEVYTRVVQNVQNFDVALQERKVEVVEKDLLGLKAEYDTQLNGLPNVTPPERENLDFAFRIKLGYLILEDVNQSYTSYGTIVDKA
jgi:hypothetical protein